MRTSCLFPSTAPATRTRLFYIPAFAYLVSPAFKGKQVPVALPCPVAEHELRVSELNLDLQHTLRGVQSARDSLAKIKKGKCNEF
jgi:hypothetical protein